MTLNRVVDLRWNVDKYYVVLPLSAGISGIVEACTTHPLDRIKTELQRLTLMKSDSSLKAGIRSIYQVGGIPSFYAGIVPRLVGIVPMRLVYWSTLNTMNRVTSEQSRVVQFLVPGVTAGCCQTLVDNPIEVFKVKLMTGATEVKLSSLYNGFVPCLYRNVIFAVAVGVSTKTYGSDSPFLAAAVGGLVGSLISQPFDVAKTELQRHQSDSAGRKRSTWRILSEIYHVSGPAKLWSGASMRCSLGFVNMGIGFLALAHIQNTLLTIL